MADQEEFVRRLTFVKQVLSRIEEMVPAHSPPPVRCIRQRCRQRRLLTEDVLNLLHAVLPLRRLIGAARMAAASAVMSIPTGHQVMHRPQPTQPDVPN